MTQTLIKKDEVTILFAGDSGDGIQLTGNQFTHTTALFGNDLSTFPNFPAEIRAPQGTLAGVSGFQLKFGSTEIYTPGDSSDVLVVMNSAGLKANLFKLKNGGIIIANESGFDKKNLRLAEYESNPLEDDSLSEFQVKIIDITKLTKECLKDYGWSPKLVDRSKNMFVLGFLYWMYGRSPEHTIGFLKKKFSKQQEILDGNIEVLKAGYHYGETSETFDSRYEVQPAKLPKGEYRNIMGNQATAIGLIAAAEKSGLDLYYGSYPITPASDILHELARHKNFGVKTFQAEDEIAAVCSAIGASFGGALGVTASSGPGIALKTEAIGLASILELPLVIINVQRGGPSTGLPTKTEQSDLFQVLYGRNGESPVPVIAASSPSDCFYCIFEAARIAVEHMTPVFFLSDGYIANGSEPWRFPKPEELKKIIPPFAKTKGDNSKPFLPYKRNQDLVRPWAIPGQKGLEHRIGGLEKEDETGNVSYDPENHEKMVKIRAERIEKIARHIPQQEISSGIKSGQIAIVSWGSTFGVVKGAVENLVKEGCEVAHIHLRYLNPMPGNLGKLLNGFEKILVPEMNNGQLIHILRSKFFVDAIGMNKIKGVPFTIPEIVSKTKEIYKSK